MAEVQRSISKSGNSPGSAARRLPLWFLNLSSAPCRCGGRAADVRGPPHAERSPLRSPPRIKRLIPTYHPWGDRLQSAGPPGGPPTGITLLHAQSWWKAGRSSEPQVCTIKYNRMIGLNFLTAFCCCVQGRLRFNLRIDRRQGFRRDWQPRSTDESDRRHLRSCGKHRQPSRPSHTALSRKCDRLCGVGPQRWKSGSQQPVLVFGLDEVRCLSPILQDLRKNITAGDRPTTCKKHHG